MIMRVRITHVHDNLVYVRISIRVPRPTQDRMNFLVFEGSFLEAPRAVLFHATAIHCHYGIDIEDASFFVLE